MVDHSALGTATRAARLVAFVVGAISAAEISTAYGQVQAIGADESERFKSVARFWEWTGFWGLDGVEFPLVAYTRGREIRGAVFFALSPDHADPAWGFCSRDLGLCHAYFSFPDGTVFQADGIRMRPGESEAAAINRYRKQGFRSDHPPPDMAWLWGRGEGAAVRTVRRAFRLPALGVPEAARLRSSNTVVEKMVRDNWKGKRGCVTIVPFADRYSPFVPVVSSCRDGEGAVQFLWRSVDEDSWYFSAGGYMPQRSVLRRFAPLARKHAGLILEGPDR